MTDRDTFAAAALTGLLACMKDETCGEICESAYWWADAMLRARGDAEPMRKEKRAEVSEQKPAAWATFYPGGSTASVHLGRVPPHAVPLYRHPQPTLTDEERETLRELMDEAALYADEIGLSTTEIRERQATLRNLLERLK